MMNSIERITAVGVSAPAGHYSHATAWNGLVFASGQLGARGDGSHTADTSFWIAASVAGNSPRYRTSRPRPPSATATALRNFDVSIPTKASV